MLSAFTASAASASLAHGTSIGYARGGKALTIDSLGNLIRLLVCVAVRLSVAFVVGMHPLRGNADERVCNQAASQAVDGAHIGMSSRFYQFLCIHTTPLLRSTPADHRAPTLLRRSIIAIVKPASPRNRNRRQDRQLCSPPKRRSWGSPLSRVGRLRCASTPRRSRLPLHLCV